MSEEEQKHLMQSYYDLHEKYYKLKTQLQQKENIIKEVREYNQKVYDTTEGNEKILAQTNLKILDKENK